MPAIGMPGVDWESCITMNNHWGYNKHDHNYKSARQLIRMLIDIASKGGNLLLNIGPTAQGEFPPESLERLEAIGRWMAVNSEAIHGTVAGPFRSPPSWGRCTARRSHADGRTTLYLHVFDWPADGRVVVPGMSNDATNAHLLAQPDTRLTVQRDESDLVVRVPAQAPDVDASVIVLEIIGEPVVYEPPVIHSPADILVQPIEVTIEASVTGVDLRYTLDGSVPALTSPLVRGPVRIEDSCTLTVRCFIDGRAVSPPTTKRFTKVSPKPVDYVTPGAVQGVLCAVYPGDWTRLPDFDALKPARLEYLPRIALPESNAEQYVARVFSGWIVVPQDGVYEFALTSDDGSRLFVGGRQVIDNDGLHVAQEQRGVIALSAGAHWYILQHFNRTGAAVCQLRMALLGQSLRSIDDSALLRNP